MNRNKTTDTNQASELFELCKQVYEATGWKDTHGRLDDGNHTIRNEGNEVLLGTKQVPLYTSDYLLEKLPAHFYGGTIAMTAETDEGPTRYSFFYEDNHETAQVVHCENVRLQGWHDTPLKALLKLTIALSEAGEL